MIVILGAGGFAREVQMLVGSLYITTVMYEDLNTRNLEPISNTPIVSNLTSLARELFVVGTGNPKLNKEFYNRAIKNGLVPYKQDGSALCKGSIVTSNVTLGKGIVLNLNVTVGHDAVIGDFCVINPNTSISGNVTLGEGVTVGANASIKPGVKVGDWAVIGMGSVVVKDVPPGATVVGNPAKILEKKAWCAE